MIYFLKSKGMRNTKFQIADPGYRREKKWDMGQEGAHQWHIANNLYLGSSLGDRYLNVHSVILL